VPASGSDTPTAPIGAKAGFRTRLTAIGLSFGIGAALMAVKFYAFYLTGSSAVLSDALESIINVAASAFAGLSIFLAARPPDESHPYGHGKIEFFSAGFEGALIILAAVGIFRTGLMHLQEPRSLPNLEGGLLILLAAGIVNLALGWMLLKTGRRTHSLTLIAEGRHVMTDVYTTGGVLIGLLLVYLTGWIWLDGAVACIVGVNILVTGGRLLYHSYSGLMDASDPDLIREVSGLLLEHGEKTWIDIHQLRAWKAGVHIHIDFHMVLPRTFSLEQAHEHARRLELLLLDHFERNASVLIHMDPCTDPDCPQCRESACDLRKHPPSNPPESAAQRRLTDNRRDHDRLTPPRV
jgi:cation diffusion facilitator family transporter